MTSAFWKKLLKFNDFTAKSSEKNYPTKLNIGCGYDKKPDYLNIDIDPSCNPDLLLDSDGNLNSLPRLYFSSILARDVLEHFPRTESLRNLLVWNELLIRGGKINIVTTDVLSVALKMNNDITYANHHGWSICLFGNQAKLGDYHLTGFTDTTLSVLLFAAGFEVIKKGYIDEWCFDWFAMKNDCWSTWLENQKSYSNEQFLDETYKKVFKRELDNQGSLYFLAQLKRGRSRRDVFLDIGSSPEALFVKAAEMKL